MPHAGLGTRLLPCTKNVAKELFPIVSKPAIEYIVGEAVEADINTMVLITNKHKGAIVDHFDRNLELEQMLISKNKTDLVKAINKFTDVNFVNVRQSEALGLGHAIYMAKHVLHDEFFLVSLPDMIVDNGAKYIKKMCQLAEQTNKPIIALMEVPQISVSNYGIVSGKFMPDNPDLFNITDLIEKPAQDKAPSNLAVLGRYILPYRVIEILEHVKPDNSGEIQLTEALIILTREIGMIGLVIHEEIHDVGCPSGFVKANMYYAMKDEKYHKELINYFNKIQ